MSTPSSYFILILLLLLHPRTTTPESDPNPDPNPYFSKTTLFSDYDKMITNLKIFIYPTTPNTNNTTYSETLPQPLSQFYTALLNSRYLTRFPNQATLFFLPFPPNSTLSTLARAIHQIRSHYPYWDKSLGADHFYLTCNDVGRATSRNVVELRKNAIQVTCFPSPASDFVPHKDVTIPPFFQISYPPRADGAIVTSTHFLGYFSSNQVLQSNEGLVNGLKNDVDFLIESKPISEKEYVENVKRTKFCLFDYDDVAGMKRLGLALAEECVPVIITRRPIQDFPLMDVIQWSKIAVFVRSNMEVEELKRVLSTCVEEEEYEERRSLGVAAAKHMTWNVGETEEGESLDAFEMVVYQIWLRRHVIRYERWELGTQSG